MRALSLWQPWGSAMALGLKRIETRHWATTYRGPLAIHAAKRWTAEEREFLADMQDCGFFPSDFGPMPLGVILAVGRLADIRRTEELEPTLTILEEEWGNYGPRRYGWIFEDIVPLAEPIPFKGMRGLFDIPDEIIRNGPPPAPEPAPPPPERPQCRCYRCTSEWFAANPPAPEETMFGQPTEMMRMFLCAICGNKRCPHAADHRNACTGSNEPGQRGSLYEDAVRPVA